MINHGFGRTIYLTLVFAFFSIGANSQALFIDFENSIGTSDFTDFDGGVATVIANPQSSGTNTSATAAQIVRNGGQIWAGSKILLPTNLDFSLLNSISMQVYTSAPIGTVVKFKLEGMGATDRDAITTVTNQWETLTWDFTATPNSFNTLVFMFDYGNVGDGSLNSTFLFDDIVQFSAGTQMDLPVDFESSTVNYVTTDFGGNISNLVADPSNAGNMVIKTIKSNTAATWAGTTIGTASGFATNIPLTLVDSKMNVRVWSPSPGTIIQLKVEDSNDNTHTCETQATTTTTGAWETLEFDFANEAPGTAQLSVGLGMGWTYNMASIFFNFGVDGQTAGEQTYYFDDVKFGANTFDLEESFLNNFEVFPNPSTGFWAISSPDNSIESIQIFDLNGRMIVNEIASSSELKINATSFEKGIYIAEIQSALGLQKIKLIKK